MELNIKQKVGIVVGYTALVAALTVYASPTKIKTEIKTVEVVKTVEVAKTDTDTNKRTKKKTIEKDLPNGEKTITTIEVDDSNTDHKTDTTVATTDDKTTDNTKEVTRSTDKVTISALAGANPFQSSQGLVYGASITKPLLGPITGGLWGLTNGTMGCSVGLTF